MGLNFIKKIFSNKEEKENINKESIIKEEIKSIQENKKEEIVKVEENIENKKEKDLSEKTDEELAKEIENYSPEIMAQAKTPEMRKMLINIYRNMLKDKVDINNEREVKKWLKKHPELAQGQESMPKVETYKRDKPKIGRNDPCPCGSGKKYKNCCGKNL